MREKWQPSLLGKIIQIKSKGMKYICYINILVKWKHEYGMSILIPGKVDFKAKYQGQSNIIWW